MYTHTHTHTYIHTSIHTKLHTNLGGYVHHLQWILHVPPKNQPTITAVARCQKRMNTPKLKRSWRLRSSDPEDSNLDFSLMYPVYCKQVTVFSNVWLFFAKVTGSGPLSDRHIQPANKVTFCDNVRGSRFSQPCWTRLNVSMLGIWSRILANAVSSAMVCVLLTRYGCIVIYSRD